MTEVALTEALGESLSPSQVSTYMTCPAKRYFRYLIVTEPTTGALALGKAFHGTLARNFRQKISTGRDMESQELKPGFHVLDIEAFVQKLKGLAPQVNPADLSSPKRIRFAIVARGWYGSVEAKVNIVRAVLSRELPVVGTLTERWRGCWCRMRDSSVWRTTNGRAQTEKPEP